MDRSVIDLFSELADNDFGFFQKMTRVDGMMSSPVITLTLDHTHAEVVEVFRKHKIHHAPVLADDGEVVGIVSDRDLHRQSPPLLGTAAEGDHDHRVAFDSSIKFMTRGVVAISEFATPITAISCMLQHHVDCVLVHNDQKELLGIITVRDFVKLVLLFHRVCSYGEELVRFRLVDLDLRQGLPLDMLFSRGAASVRDVMTKKVITVSEEAPLSKAIELMQKHEFRHLPVTDERGRLVGMLSDREIVKALPTPVANKLPDGDGFRQRLFNTCQKRTRELDIRVGKLANQQDFKVDSTEFFSKAIQRFLETDDCGLVVVEPTNGKLCGILTSTDVLRVICNTLQIATMLASVQREAAASSTNAKSGYEESLPPAISAATTLPLNESQA